SSATLPFRAPRRGRDAVLLWVDRSIGRAARKSGNRWRFKGDELRSAQPILRATLSLPVEKTLLPSLTSSPDQKQVGELLRRNDIFKRRWSRTRRRLKRGKDGRTMLRLHDDRLESAIKRIAE